MTQFLLKNNEDLLANLFSIYEQAAKIATVDKVQTKKDNVRLIPEKVCFFLPGCFIADYFEIVAKQTERTGRIRTGATVRLAGKTRVTISERPTKSGAKSPET